MFISDLSIKRPVFASVVSLLLIVFGVVAFIRLPLREYPDIDPPVVSIETVYPGASASVVETRITKLIEDRISGVEGIRSVESRSIDGRSNITIQFEVDRDVDAAANDIRDRVSGILDDLPAEADPPDIRKADADADVIIWLNLAGDNISIMELTDYARRYLVDRFSTLGGVARVQIGGGLEYSMRIWVDSNQLAARNLTITDVENALRSENIELPAGNVESRTRDFRVRIQRGYRTVADFENLVLTRSADGYLVRLRDVARVETGPAERRNMLRGNGVPMVGIGIVKQSKANTLAVAKLAKAEAAAINKDLPEGMRILQSYDSSVFIESAIDGVYMALFEAVGLVVLVIYLILGSFRATLVPAVAVPVSLVATFIVLLASGFTINLLTLLALVLAIGLVVDDAVVILENIYRHIQMGEGRLAAAYRGTRELGFAVIASTVVLLADSASLNRYNRIRSITIEANLTEGYSLGEALTYLSDLVRTELPPGVSIGYKGESLEYITSGRSIYFIFLLALVVVYLAMAAQFESYIHPFVIMLTVPLAIAGALFGLFLTGQSLNIYSQIGMIMLVGLATKNGILIVEFANQLRDAGASFEEALLEASRKRLRPILMTAMPTAVGAIPLVFASGAGSEARLVIGIVILAGIIVATAFTLYMIPCAYHMLARGTSSPRATTRELERQLKKV